MNVNNAWVIAHDLSSSVEELDLPCIFSALAPQPRHCEDASHLYAHWSHLEAAANTQGSHVIAIPCAEVKIPKVKRKGNICESSVVSMAS